MTIWFVQRDVDTSIIAAFQNDQDGTLVETRDDTIDADIIAFLAAQAAAVIPPLAPPALAPIFQGSEGVGPDMFGVVRAGDLGTAAFSKREDFNGWSVQEFGSTPRQICAHESGLLLVMTNATNANVFLPPIKDVEPSFNIKIRARGGAIRLFSFSSTDGLINGLFNTSIIIPNGCDADISAYAVVGDQSYWQVNYSGKQITRLSAPISYTANVTIATITDLTAVLAPGRKYKFSIKLWFSPVDVTGGSRVRLQITGTPQALNYQVRATNLSAATPVFVYGSVSQANNTSFFGAGGTLHFVEYDGVIFTDASAASQTLIIRAAQAVANGTTTIIDGVVEVEEIL